MSASRRTRRHENGAKSKRSHRGNRRARKRGNKKSDEENLDPCASNHPLNINMNTNIDNKSDEDDDLNGSSPPNMSKFKINAPKQHRGRHKNGRNMPHSLAEWELCQKIISDDIRNIFRICEETKTIWSGKWNELSLTKYPKPESKKSKNKSYDIWITIKNKGINNKLIDFNVCHFDRLGSFRFQLNVNEM